MSVKTSATGPAGSESPVIGRNKTAMPRIIRQKQMRLLGKFIGLRALVRHTSPKCPNFGAFGTILEDRGLSGGGRGGSGELAQRRVKSGIPGNTGNNNRHEQFLPNFRFRTALCWWPRRSTNSTADYASCRRGHAAAGCRIGSVYRFNSRRRSKGGASFSGRPRLLPKRLVNGSSI
jgi:hypothetical protein